MNELNAAFIIEDQNNKFILIRDLANEINTMSVTNDAENIIDFLTLNFNIVNKKVFYIDTDERVDELLHDNKGNFIGFKDGYDNLELFKQNNK